MSGEKTTPGPNIPKPTATQITAGIFSDRVRELAREAGITQPLTEEDVRAVLDWFQSDPDPEYRPLPSDLDSPELWAELQRRSERDDPALNVRTVKEQLERHWAQAQP